MAKIKVDHSKFESAASEIEDYVDILKKKMNGVQGEVNNICSAWQGSDFNQFKTEFDKLDNGDSTHTQMVKALESYAKYLRFAAKKYKETQAGAIDRANRLPRW